MPAQSKSQYKFMQAMASEGAKNRPKGLSKEEAAEFVRETKSPDKLPKTKKKRKFKSLS